MIDIKKIDPSPYQHRKYFDEDRLREDLSMIEFIEATIKIIDVEMGKDPWYLTVGKTPLERVHKLLSKLDSIRICKDRGSLVSKVADDQFHKYVELVESIFKNLPKPLKWRSFLTHDLILLTDIPLKVQKASVKLDLNKAQTKALARLEQLSDKVFQDVIQKGSIPFKDRNNHLLATPALNEFSAREIQAFAKDMVADTCLALNRQCWSFDLLDRIKTRSEIW